jgi:hypothetical protein
VIQAWSLLFLCVNHHCGGWRQENANRWGVSEQVRRYDKMLPPMPMTMLAADADDDADDDAAEMDGNAAGKCTRKKKVEQNTRPKDIKQPKC